MRSDSEIAGLLERAIGGESEAFGEIYDVYLDRIYRYVFHHVRDKMMAEDVTEEVFLKAWERIESCKGREQTFLAWLYRIAHNQMIDHVRSRQKYLSADMDNVPDTDDLETEVEAKLEWQEVLEAISCLPERQKQVITLKFAEGLDNREIGLITGKRQGAVRILQMRALATLRRSLARQKQ
ncbi:MAG: sigma-70 family RNA polymerase sigma factor [Chloroflexota bacterium]